MHITLKLLWLVNVAFQIIIIGYSVGRFLSCLRMISHCGDSNTTYPSNLYILDYLLKAELHTILIKSVRRPWFLLLVTFPINRHSSFIVCMLAAPRSVARCLCELHYHRHVLLTTPSPTRFFIKRSLLLPSYQYVTIIIDVIVLLLRNSWAFIFDCLRTHVWCVCLMLLFCSGFQAGSRQHGTSYWRQVCISTRRWVGKTDCMLCTACWFVVVSCSVFRLSFLYDDRTIVTGLCMTDECIPCGVFVSAQLHMYGVSCPYRKSRNTHVFCVQNRQEQCVSIVSYGFLLWSSFKQRLFAVVTFWNAVVTSTIFLSKMQATG